MMGAVGEAVIMSAIAGREAGKPQSFCKAATTGRASIRAAPTVRSGEISWPQVKRRPKERGWAHDSGNRKGVDAQGLLNAQA